MGQRSRCGKRRRSNHGVCGKRIVVSAPMHAIKHKPDGYYQLLERALLGPRSKCQLSSNSEKNKNGRCSICPYKQEEFEFDHVLARLIENGTIHRLRLCPYQIFAGMLLEDLDLEAERVENWKRGLAIKKLERAKKDIAGALAMFGHDIEIHKDADELYRRLDFVGRSQRIIGRAITALKAVYKEPKPKTGHPGKLDARAITAGCLASWRLLVGKEVGKNNTQFLDLLSATWIAVEGSNKREPDWQHQIKAAKKRRADQ
jgi:hypothetical protein